MNDIKSVYLAQAVDMRDDRAVEMTKKIKSALLAMDLVTFDPSEAFQLKTSILEEPDNTEQGEYIFGVNLFAFLNAEMRVFVYTGAASWGLPIELYMAVKKHLSFVFLDFTKSGYAPVYLREMLNLAGAVKVEEPLDGSFLAELVRGVDPQILSYLRIWATPMEG